MVIFVVSISWDRPPNKTVPFNMLMINTLLISYAVYCIFINKSVIFMVLFSKLQHAKDMNLYLKLCCYDQIKA